MGHRYKHFFGATPKFSHSLCTVGEMGTVKIKMDTTPKLEDHGVHCVFVGYSLTHPNECCCMYDPKLSEYGCLVMWFGYIACFTKKLKVHQQQDFHCFINASQLNNPLNDSDLRLEVSGPFQILHWWHPNLDHYQLGMGWQLILPISAHSSSPSNTSCSFGLLLGHLCLSSVARL